MPPWWDVRQYVEDREITAWFLLDLSPSLDFGTLQTQKRSVLIDFVNRITPLLRRSDQLGRFGGEEFVVLLPETSQEEALVVAERIRTHVELPVKGLPSITVSIGMSANRPDEGELDVLLARADKALYKAKQGGRNRIEAA